MSADFCHVAFSSYGVQQWQVSVEGNEPKAIIKKYRIQYNTNGSLKIMYGKLQEKYGGGNKTEGSGYFA